MTQLLGIAVHVCSWSFKPWLVLLDEWKHNYILWHAWQYVSVVKYYNGQCCMIICPLGDGPVFLNLESSKTKWEVHSDSSWRLLVGWVKIPDQLLVFIFYIVYWVPCKSLTVHVDIRIFRVIRQHLCRACLLHQHQHCSEECQNQHHLGCRNPHHRMRQVVSAVFMAAYGALILPSFPSHSHQGKWSMPE